MAAFVRELRELVVGPVRSARDFGRRVLWRIGTPHPAPIIVVGNQKSGTTVIARLLAAHIGKEASIDVFHKLRDFSVEDAVFGGELSLDTFIRTHARFFRAPVIKEPSFTFFDEELRKIFPAARFVFVARDPRDNIRSMLNRLDLSARQAVYGGAAMESVLAVPRNRGWVSIVAGRNPPSRRDSVIATLAERWRIAVRPLLEAPSRFVTVRYEDFSSAKRDVIEQLARDLGETPAVDIGPLADRQFQPKGDNSLSWLEYFGPEHLDCIEETCATGMRALRYPRMAQE